MPNDLRASIVRICNAQGRTLGTGFVVTDDGLIATCAHVVQGAGSGPGERVRLAFQAEGAPMEAEVLIDGWYPDQDVAFLRLTTPPPESITSVVLGPSVSASGHTFRACGHPRVGEFQGVWAEGQILGSITDSQGREMLQLRAQEIAPGMSGAPVLDVSVDQVVGIVAETYISDETAKFRDAAFAIPAEVLCALRPSEIILAKPKVVSRLQDFLDAVIDKHRYHSLTWGTKIASHDLSLTEVYIEQRLHPDSPKRPGGQLEQDTYSSTDTVSATEILQQYRHLIFLGKPGSGKSTLLHRLALHMAESCTIAQDGSFSGRLPILLPLKFWEGNQGQTTVPFSERLLNHIVHQNSGLPRDDLKELMEQGKVALLLDALDEIGNPSQRNSMVQEIQRLAGSSLGTRCLIVATSRSGPYRKGKVLGYPFQTFILSTLDEIGQKQFVRRWLTALARADSKSDTWLNTQVETLEKELAERRGLKRILRNPLLLIMTVVVYVEWEEIPKLYGRYEKYINLMLRRGGVRGKLDLEPVWDEPEQAKQCLAELAWSMHNRLRGLTRAEAIELLSTTLSKEEAHRFLRDMVDKAGLLDVQARQGDYDSEKAVFSFAPHQTFRDYFVGYSLWQQWQRNKKRTRNILIAKADLPDWQPAILFCLGLLDEKDAWSLVTGELKRQPLWGVRCLHEGLELTYDELDRSKRRQVFKQLERQGKKLLHPGLRTKTLNLRRFISEEAVTTAWERQYEALRALGMLQVQEVGPILLKAVPYYHKSLLYQLRDVFTMLGSRVLWPGIQSLLMSENSEISNRAARTVASWRGQEALEPLKWLLENADRYRALQGLSSLGLPESEAICEAAFADQFDYIAFEVALEQRRPGMIERAITELEIGNMSSNSEITSFVYYLTSQSLDEAVAALERLLAKPRGFEIRDIFESPPTTLMLPLLRLLIPLLHHPNPDIVEDVNLAIWYVFKSNRLDPFLEGAQPVLEQILIFGDDSTRNKAIEMLQTTTLSAQACEMLIERIDLSAPEWYETILPIGSLPPIPDAYRERFIEALTPGLESEETRYLTTVTLGKLGVRAVIPTIIQMLDKRPNDPDSRLVDVLVQMCALEALPYIRRWSDDSNHWRYREALLAMTLIAPNAQSSERQDIIYTLRHKLTDSNWHVRMTAVYGLGQLQAREATPDILAVLQKGDLHQEQAVVGLALSQMGWNPGLARQLDQAFVSRNGHICGTVVHAWGASGAAQAAVPLLKGIGQENDYLRQTNEAIVSLETAFDFLRARMAMSLGRLAVSLSPRRSSHHQERLKQGWRALVNELPPARTVVEKAVYPALAQAIKQAQPARSLYEQMTQARGQIAVTLGLLAGAYEWSTVLLSLAEQNELDNLDVWEQIVQCLDSNPLGIDLTDEYVFQLQEQLRQRLGWYVPGLPFAYTLELRRQRHYALERLAWHFHYEAGEWHDYLKWHSRYLNYPRD